MVRHTSWVAYLFLKGKKELGSRHFATGDVMNAVDHFLRAQNDTYSYGVSLLHDRRTKCVNVGRDYVEKLLHLIF